MLFLCYYYTGSPPRNGPAAAKPTWVSHATLLILLFLSSPFQSVSEKRTALYNKLVVSYHKAKTERSSLARQLEVAQGGSLFCFTSDHFVFINLPADAFCRLVAAAAQVPQLQEELQLSREQCSAS